jgi:hypothetical protein
MSTIGYITTRVQPGSFDSFGFFDFIVKEVVCILALFYLTKYDMLSFSASTDEHLS